MVSTGMHARPNAHQGAKYSTSTLVRWLYLPAGLYLVFVVYGSLVPLNFSPVSFDEAIERFRQIQFLNLGIGSRADWVANGLLMIPLAFLLCGSIWGKPPAGHLLGAIFVLIFCAALSIAIEFTQIYFPPRTVSQNDIFAETVGSAIGIALWWRTGSLYLNFIERLDKISGTQSVSEKALWAYLALVYGYSLLPLDLTISPVEVYHKWVDGKVVLIPFSALPGTPIEFIYEFLTDVVIWIPVSMLLVLSARKSAGGAIAWTVAVAALLEFLQLFVFSRVSDITDIFTALIGAISGATLARHFQWKTPAPKARIYTYSAQKLGAGILLFSLWTVVLMLVFWYPYDFNFEGSFLRQRVSRFSDVPFQSYYMGTEFRAITELIRRLFFFMPLGVILLLVKPPNLSTNSSRFYTAFSTLAILGVATIIELGQAALPSKFPNNTDIFLQFLGGVLGLIGAAFIRTRVLEQPQKHIPTDLDSVASVTGTPILPAVKWDLQSSLILLLALVFVSALASALLDSHSIPYNIRELVEGEYRWLRVVGLIVTAYWVFGMPMTVLLGQLNSLESISFQFPKSIVGLITLHTLTTWVLVWLVFPLESIHDIVGAPVWQSFRPLELTLRFLSLFLFVSTIVWSASTISLSQLSRVELRKGALVTITIIALFIAHLIIIRFASTDNIIELLRNKGRSWSSIFIPAYLMLAVYCGLSLSLIRRLKSRKFWIHVLILLVSAPVGYWLLHQGLEEFVIKYGKVFSAMQFLLSANRDSYLDPQLLFVRFCTAHYALVILISLLQLHLWLGWWSNPQIRAKKLSRIFQKNGQLT